MFKLIRSKKMRMHRKEIDFNSKYVKRNINIWIQMLEKLDSHTMNSDQSKNDHTEIFLFE